MTGQAAPRSGGRRAKRMDKLDQKSELALADQTISDLMYKFAQVANDASSINEVDDFLAANLDKLGVANFILVQAMDRGRKPTGALMSGRSLEAWRKRYEGAGHAANDDLMKAGYRSPNYFTWQDYRDRTDVPGPQQRIFDEAAEFGLKDGFYLPLHQRDGAMFAVALLSNREIERKGRVLPSLHMLGVYYHLAVLRLVSRSKEFLSLASDPKFQLTPRQTECLQWVRAGKTDWEISQILGISEHTVIEHLEEARKRLNVRTRTQAVINAIHYGLIQL